MKINFLIVASLFLTFGSFASGKNDAKEMRAVIDKGLDAATVQSKKMAESLIDQNDKLPRTIGKRNVFTTSNAGAWTSGFFREYYGICMKRVGMTL